jgi:hypothetical protein
MSIAPEPSPESDTPPTVPLVSAGAADRCLVCGAHLAVDQRYCVECGTRRGAPRFTLAGQGASGAPAAAPAASPAGGASRFLSSSSAVLLIGLLILLIALGVGVLIGHDNSPKPIRGASVTVVNDGGSDDAGATSSAPNIVVKSAGTSGSASSGTGAPTTSKAKSSSTTKAPAKQAAPAAAATKSKAAASGKSGTGTAAKTAKTFSTTATKKSTLGGKCTPGTTGCSKSGQQTGNLF